MKRPSKLAESISRQEYEDIKERASRELLLWARTDATGEPTQRLRSALHGYYVASRCEMPEFDGEQGRKAKRLIVLMGLVTGILAFLSHRELQYIKNRYDSLTERWEEAEINC